MDLNRPPSNHQSSNQTEDLGMVRQDSFELIRNYDTFSPQPPIDKNLNQQNYNLMKPSKPEINSDFKMKRKQEPTMLQVEHIDCPFSENDKFGHLNRNLSGNFGFQPSEDVWKKPSTSKKVGKTVTLQNNEVTQMPKLDLNNIMRFLKSN